MQNVPDLMNKMEIPKYKCRFLSVGQDTIKDMCPKTLEIDYLSEYSIKNAISKNEDIDCKEAEEIYKMMKYHLNHKKFPIYEKTDYFYQGNKNCRCVKNVNADVFRKIKDGINYEKDMIYISIVRDDNNK